LHILLCLDLMFPSIIRISTQTVHGDYTNPLISVNEKIDILLVTHSTVGFSPLQSVMRPGLKSSNLNSSSLTAIYKPDILEFVVLWSNPYNEAAVGWSMTQVESKVKRLSTGCDVSSSFLDLDSEWWVLACVLLN